MSISSPRTVTPISGSLVHPTAHAFIIIHTHQQPVGIVSIGPTLELKVQKVRGMGGRWTGKKSWLDTTIERSLIWEGEGNDKREPVEKNDNGIHREKYPELDVGTAWIQCMGNI
jgi:hypothetical protein